MAGCFYVLPLRVKHFRGSIVLKHGVSFHTIWSCHSAHFGAHWSHHLMCPCWRQATMANFWPRKEFQKGFSNTDRACVESSSDRSQGATRKHQFWHIWSMVTSVVYRPRSIATGVAFCCWGWPDTPRLRLSIGTMATLILCPAICGSCKSDQSCANSRNPTKPQQAFKLHQRARSNPPVILRAPLTTKDPLKLLIHQLQHTFPSLRPQWARLCSDSNGIESLASRLSPWKKCRSMNDFRCARSKS